MIDLSRLQVSSITAGLGLASVVLYFVTVRVSRAASRRQLAAQHGCLPVKHPLWFDDLFYGIPGIMRGVRLMKEGKALETGIQQFGTFGSTFAIKQFHLNLIFTCDPEVSKAVMSTNFKDFDLGPRKIFVGKLFGKGILLAEGEQWRHSKEILRPSFGRANMADLPTLEHHVDHMVSLLPRDGTPVNLEDFFFRLTADASSELFLGKSVNSLGAPAKKGERRFFEAFGDALSGSAMPARRGMMMLLPDRQLAANIDFVKNYIDDIVQEAIQDARDNPKAPSPGDKHVVLRDLVARIPDNPAQIRDELISVLSAGRETTASLLTNLFFVIAQRQDIQQKLRAELDALGGAAPTYQQLRDLKYLRWCIDESLRLHPAAPVNERWAVRDVVLPRGGGPDGAAPMLVPKGSAVIWNMFVMHRRADVFGADALEFRPERWADLRPGWAYTPFNAGPRNCIGQELAHTETAYTTVRMLQHFSRMESCDPGPWVEKIGITIKSRSGAKVVLTP